MRAQSPERIADPGLTRSLDPASAQMASGTILIAPHGHSETHSPQPLQ